MAALASRIREQGLTPGLWLAPFAAHRHSNLVDRYPEFLLLDQQGEPVRFAHNWGQDGLALDVTRPDVLEWLAETIATVIGWGFGYLKLDFLYAGAFPGQRHVGMGREMGYRRAIEAIRSAAGDTTFLLACGAPVIPSIGVFDGIRVGPDTAPFWEDTARIVWLQDWSGPGTRNALATSLNRLWLREAIAVDPDVAFFRARHNTLSLEHRQLSQDMATISGFRSTSDPPAWLDSEERQRLESFLVATPKITRHSDAIFEIDDRLVDFRVALLDGNHAP
jgi:alpha-galactosidase